MSYKCFDVVTVPFPFTDSSQKKKRPALVLSSDNQFNRKIGHSIMAMITSIKNRPWPLDVTVTDLHQAGLPAASVVRMKFFTLDHRLVLEKKGTLSSADRTSVSASVCRVFEELIASENSANTDS